VQSLPMLAGTHGSLVPAIFDCELEPDIANMQA